MPFERRHLSWISIFAGVAVALVGFVMNQMWFLLPAGPVLVLLAIAMAALVASYGAARVTGCAWATASLLVWLAACVGCAGFASAVAVLLIAAAAFGLGSLILPRDNDMPMAMPLVVGIAVICGGLGWLLPFRMHFMATYMVFMLALIICRWRHLAAAVRAIPGAWTATVTPAPKSALLAVMAMGVASTFAWGPTIHGDDLGYHLGLPSQLASLGYYQMNVGTSVWANAAWGADIVQAIAQVISSTESHGMVGVLWLALAASLLWRLCGTLGLGAALRWLAVALYISIPLTASTLDGMQTEGPTAAVAVAIAYLVFSQAAPRKRHVVAAALLFGLLLELKISNLMLAGPLGLLMLWQWRGGLPWRIAPLAVVLGVLVAGSSYAYSWALTGNPVLPLFNGVFHSSYYPNANFHDSHWIQKIRWDFPWRLVFHTSDFVEGGDGSVGFGLLALAGCLVIAIIRRGSRPLALTALAALVLPLTQLPYIRYAQPSFILLIPCMLCGLPRQRFGCFGKRAIAWLLGILVILGLLFFANGEWQYQYGMLGKYLVGGNPAIIADYAPQRQFADVVRVLYPPDARVLVTDQTHPFVAEYAGSAFSPSWYDPELSRMVKAADTDASGKAWNGIFRAFGTNLVTLAKSRAAPGLFAAISANKGERVYVVGDLELWALHGGVSGSVVSSPPGSVSVDFDIAKAPPEATLLDAQVDLRCMPKAGPIVFAWVIGQAGGNSIVHYASSRCADDGHVIASLDTSLPGPATSLMVTATPSKSPDIALVASSSSAWLRRDRMAERDLALHMRERWAAWIDSAKQTSISGIPARRVSAPAGAVIVQFDTSKVPKSAAAIDADITLACKAEQVPIVLAWKFKEAGRDETVQYKLARCDGKGSARGSIRVLISNGGSTSFSLIAVPATPSIDAIQFHSAEAYYEEGNLFWHHPFIAIRQLLAAWVRPAATA
jgi:hypothetical protein